MNNQFIIKGLNYKDYTHLFNAQVDVLQAHHAVWLTADEQSGYPCRVSLKDVEVGERVLLLHYVHHDVSGPYRASGPIFIGESSQDANLEVNEIPQVLCSRLLSLRAYDQQGNMVSAKTAQGEVVDIHLHEMFNIQSVEYIQIHNANPGCFSCTAYRA